MIDFEKLKSRRLAVWIIGLPMALALLYYSVFSIDRYVSEAKVVVRQTSTEAPPVPGLAAMLGGVNPTSREETIYLREFITSIDMLNVLRRELDWNRHYAWQWRDPLFWVTADAPSEDLLKYYKRVVRAHFDEETGLLSVEVQAFDPEFAEKSLQIILAESERFVNELSHRMAREQMRFAQTELANARKVYEERRQEMLMFQGDNKLLDAEAAAQARAGIIAELEGSLIKERAALKALQATLSDHTPQVRQQRTRIQALEQQLKAESQKLVSPPGGDQMNVVAAKYRNLNIDVQIAEEAYKFAVSAVETARVEANKKIRSLVTVVMANRPDLPIFPRRAYNLIALLIGLMLLYGIVRFVIATIEDHRD